MENSFHIAIRKLHIFIHSQWASVSIQDIFTFTICLVLSNISRHSNCLSSLEIEAVIVPNDLYSRKLTTFVVMVDTGVFLKTGKQTALNKLFVSCIQREY